MMVEFLGSPMIAETELNNCGLYKFTKHTKDKDKRITNCF